MNNKEQLTNNNIRKNLMNVQSTNNTDIRTGNENINVELIASNEYKLSKKTTIEK
ncbi:14338_t:CDS:2, partial [Dentiscutata erythropus]